MTSTQLTALSLTLGATLFFASDLMAQRRGMMRMMGGGGQLASSLLAMSEVQEELGFTDEQKEEIGKKASEINSTLRSEAREIMMGGGEMSEVMDLMKELREEEKAFVAKLDEKQSKRFRQLQLQRMGNEIFRAADVQKAIGISDKQKEQIEDAFQVMGDKMEEARQEAMESRDIQAMRDAMESLGKELTEAINETLSEKQRAQVEEMKGEAFEFPRRQRQRRNRTDF